MHSIISYTARQHVYARCQGRGLFQENRKNGLIKESSLKVTAQRNFVL